MSKLLTVGDVVAPYCHDSVCKAFIKMLFFFVSSVTISSLRNYGINAIRVSSVRTIATKNVRYFSHAFVNIDIAPLIVTNGVLSTL